MGADFVSFLVFLVVCFAAGGIGSVWTIRSIPTWYATLEKPSWNPPNKVFGPVWSVLYLLMAISGFLVWKASGSGAALALTVFGVQIVLNAAWSWLFFGLRRPGLAFAEVLAFWCSIALTLVLFWQHSVIAALLLIPYLAWVSFASVLNYAVWRLNSPVMHEKGQES